MKNIRNEHEKQDHDQSPSPQKSEGERFQETRESRQRHQEGKERRSSESTSRYPLQWGDTPLRDVIDRFFDDRVWMEPFDLLRTPRVLNRFDRAFFPRVDVSETDRDIKVVADVPGIDPNAITVDVRGNRVSLSAEVDRTYESAEGERPYRYERTYGSFHRDITLPTEVKEDEVRAICKDGMLTITLPKVEEEQRKKITIERS